MRSTAGGRPLVSRSVERLGVQPLRRGHRLGTAAARTSCSMSWAAPSSASGGAMYRATARTPAGAVRHRRAVADLGQHLDIVPLVADRQRRASGTRRRRASQRTARPFDTPGATNSRNRGCEIVDVRPARECGARERAPSRRAAAARRRRAPSSPGGRWPPRRSGTSSARCAHECGVVLGASGRRRGG